MFVVVVVVVERCLSHVLDNHGKRQDLSDGDGTLYPQA